MSRKAIFESAIYEGFSQRLAPHNLSADSSVGVQRHLSLFWRVQSVNEEQIRVSKLRTQLFDVIVRSHGKMARLSELSIRPVIEPDVLSKERESAKIRMPAELQTLVKTKTEKAVLKNLAAEVEKFNLVIDGFTISGRRMCIWLAKYVLVWSR